MSLSKKTYVAALVLVIAACTSSRELLAQQVMGARGLALGQSVTALPDYQWSAFGNPALLDGSSNFVSFYGIRNYGFVELTDYAAVGNYNHSFGTTGLAFHRYGDDLFSETRIRLAYKYEYENVHLGAAINYSNIAFGGEYNSSNALGLDLGIATELTDGFWLGARTSNLNRPQYSDIDEDLPREFALGISYTIERVLLTSDLVKDVRFPVSYRGGIEYQIVDQVYLRTGITTEPVTYAFGFGYRTAQWNFDLGAQNHIDLGISPAIGFKRNF